MIRAKRGDKEYLYHSEWLDGKAVKTYYGTGAIAEAAAAEIEAQRVLRRERRQAQEQVDRKLRQALQFARMFETHCDDLTAAALLAAGYHRPAYKPWRRRRVRRTRD